VDNVTFDQFGINCPACFALGETHICGSHPHRPLATQRGNYPVPVNFILFPSHILHICILFAFYEFHLMRLIL
jgi:hypothetical protein